MEGVAGCFFEEQGRMKREGERGEGLMEDEGVRDAKQPLGEKDGAGFSQKFSPRDLMGQVWTVSLAILGR